MYPDGGQYCKNKVIVLNDSAPRRTDLSFRLQTDEDHHLGQSPLLQLPIELVTHFPVEPMHAVFLGVMRRILHAWG